MPRLHQQGLGCDGSQLQSACCFTTIADPSAAVPCLPRFPHRTLWQWYYRLRFGTGKRGCSFETYEENTRAMLETLQREAPNSKVMSL